VANQVLSWYQSTHDTTLKRDFPTDVDGPGVVPSSNKIQRVLDFGNFVEPVIQVQMKP